MHAQRITLLNPCSRPPPAASDVFSRNTRPTDAPRPGLRGHTLAAACITGTGTQGFRCVERFTLAWPGLPRGRVHQHRPGTACRRYALCAEVFRLETC